jgi:hypothetical protein
VREQEMVNETKYIGADDWDLCSHCCTRVAIRCALGRVNTASQTDILSEKAINEMVRRLD